MDAHGLGHTRVQTAAVVVSLRRLPHGRARHGNMTPLACCAFCVCQQGVELLVARYQQQPASCIPVPVRCTTVLRRARSASFQDHCFPTHGAAHPIAPLMHPFLLRRVVAALTWTCRHVAPCARPQGVELLVARFQQQQAVQQGQQGQEAKAPAAAAAAGGAAGAGGSTATAGAAAAAAKSDGCFVCPRTGNVYNRSELRRAFVV